MKFITYVAIAATLFAVAAAVTTTIYSDSACKNAVPTTSALPNPFVANLNACTKFTTVGQVSIYVKATACGGGKTTGQLYSDDKCATPQGDATISNTDKCESSDGVYRMTTCASTSSVTMAFLAVAAAVLALSF
jgi:hypothetical protein